MSKTPSPKVPTAVVREDGTPKRASTSTCSRPRPQWTSDRTPARPPRRRFRDEVSAEGGCHPRTKGQRFHPETCSDEPTGVLYHRRLVPSPTLGNLPGWTLHDRYGDGNPGRCVQGREKRRREHGGHRSDAGLVYDLTVSDFCGVPRGHRTSEPERPLTHGWGTRDS